MRFDGYKATLGGYGTKNVKVSLPRTDSWSLVVVGVEQQTLGRALCGAIGLSWLSWRCPGFKLRFETALSIRALTNHVLACNNVHVTTDESMGDAMARARGTR